MGGREMDGSPARTTNIAASAAACTTADASSGPVRLASRALTSSGSRRRRALGLRHQAHVADARGAHHAQHPHDTPVRDALIGAQVYPLPGATLRQRAKARAELLVAELGIL